MRGLLLVGLFALFACATPFQHGDLPKYMKDFTPLQVLNELESLLGKSDVNAIVGSKGINEALVNIFEKLREKLQEGFPAYGVPPLDPLYVEHTAIDIDANSAQVKGAIDNTTILGISGYLINSVEMNVLKMTMAYDLLFPEIDVSGEKYDIDGVLAIMPIYGTGAFQMIIHNMSIIGEMKMGIVNGSVQLLDIPMDVNFPALTCNLEGIMGGGEMAAIVNQMIMDLAPAVFNEVKAPILDAVGQVIMKFANEKMQGMTFQDIIDIILGIGGGFASDF